ncbi:hypothetical protein HK096_005580, partial [Nowakowskiella sp. JEL0078]
AAQTIIRDRSTLKEDFIFFANRIARLVIERALEELPFDNIQVMTPVGNTYEGKRAKFRACGVSVIGSGEIMETAFLSILKDTPLGKVTIKKMMTSERKHEILSSDLPSDISLRYVLLLDAAIATGTAAMLAIQDLKKNNVTEDKIILCSLIGTLQGIQNVCGEFPG